MSATKPKPAPLVKRETPLESVAALAAELREAEMVTARVRARFEHAVRRAHAAKHLQREIAEAAGLSRQRVVQLLAKDAP